MSNDNLDLPLLKNVVCLYPRLFHAVDFKGNGKFNYECSFLIPADSPQKAAIDAAIKAGAKDAFGDKAAVWLKKLASDQKNSCWKDADDEFPGMWRFSAKRQKDKGRPTVADRTGQPLTEDDGKPYGGAIVNAEVQVWFQAGETPGLRGRFTGVQFVRHGEVIEGGGGARTASFAAIEDDEDEESLV